MAAASLALAVAAQVDGKGREAVPGHAHREAFVAARVLAKTMHHCQ